MRRQQQQQRRRQQRGDPEAADPNKVVNGVELGTGRILELSCYLSPERISEGDAMEFDGKEAMEMPMVEQPLASPSPPAPPPSSP